MTSTAFISHRDCYLHDMGSYHPESPARLSAISDHLIAQGLEAYFVHHEAPLATLEQLARVHPAAHLEHLKRKSPQLGIVHLDPDTAMCPHTWQAALRSAGAGIEAVDLVMRGEVENAFCAVRPPGHHAERENAMGFCFFNNIAVAAAHALAAHGLERVAIVDFDVHHGNGTEDAFRNDPRVLMTSIFQHPFFPYCGADSHADNMLNVPLPAGADSEQFRAVVSEQWLPRLRQFRPQMVLISAGFDAHGEDEMGNMRLTEKDFAWVTDEVRRIAKETAQGRIVSMLEGGYSLSSLARSVAAHLRALADL
ncbi:histone deacetylase family protein [Rhodocyclus tenuis]|uniref:Acetoin utilization deacetylase AcuC-like enzyme n=1 Tax=Rhodocyclus tenuis TaxID=1066 RepID=A0A840GFN6_RHOTE|nr:histone deacetylase family protein [Rhodocyclus tenuis]MBB4247039.1 acetoin utilization deacetylase AcuC-like enzyme [Rhodocyclus tenuis]